MKLLIDCLAQPRKYNTQKATSVPQEVFPYWLITVRPRNVFSRHKLFPGTGQFIGESAICLGWWGDVCVIEWVFRPCLALFSPFTWWIQYKLGRSRFSYYIKTIRNRTRFKLYVLFLMFALGFRRNWCLSIIWLTEGNSSKEKHSHVFVYLSGS